MTRRNLNLNELERIAGGATEIAEDGASPAASKDSSPMNPSASSTGGGGGSVDTEDFAQNGEL